MSKLLTSSKTVLDYVITTSSARYLSNKSAYITKIHRDRYLRMYPTLVVEYDGSTYTTRHYEPRQIIKLPLDISTVSEEEAQAILERRKPKKKVVFEEEIDDNFSSEVYLNLMKK